MSLHELIPILQVAIGPVILFSGIGLLLLCMTNRLARVNDRTRHLLLALRSTSEAELELLHSQLHIFSKRALLVRLSIILAASSALLAAVLVITLFLAAILRWEAVVLVVIQFICCMGFLIGSLVVFLRDINLSLVSIKLELAGRCDRLA